MTPLPLGPLLFLAQSVLGTSELPKCCKASGLPALSAGSPASCSLIRGHAPVVPGCAFTSNGSLSLEGALHDIAGYDFKCYAYDDLQVTVGPLQDVIFCLEYPTSEVIRPRSDMAILRVPSEEKLVLNAVGFLLSVPFSLATLLAFALIKQMASLHGSIVMRYMFCHVCSCVTMGLADLLVISTTSGYLCIATGYAVQFFFTSTFFWLNVMCFDMYRTFRGMRNTRTRSKEEVRRKLRRYSLYAWLTPLVILMVTVFMDQYRGIPETSVFKPRMGASRCFFREERAKWIYFYSSIAVIILCDIYMFVVTAYSIWRQSREFLRLNTFDSRRHNGGDIEKYSICLKLFFMMGAKWVLELLSSQFYDNNLFWYAVDFANAMEGFFFFSVLVWNKRFRKLVWAKIRCSG